MTYSKDKIAGLSVADAIGVICTSATDASRWADFKGCIELSSDQIASIGGDYVRRSIVELPPDREKTQLEIDEEAYAAALRPLVRGLAAGGLVVKCRAIALGAAAPLFEFPADGWDENWRLIVDGKSAILVDNNGARYKLLSFQAVSGELLPADNFPKSKYLSFVPDVDSIMDQEHPPSLTEACRRALRPHLGKGDDIDNRVKQLRNVYKEVKGKKGAPAFARKLRKNVEIP